MEWSTYLQFFLALIFVLGLILAMSWAMKRFGFGGGGTGPLARRRRVAMIESAALDNRHRVVLLRRDNVEHLVLVGPNTSQVIESGIPRAADADMETPAPSPLASFRQLLSKEKQP